MNDSIKNQVQLALAEDVGAGDISASIIAALPQGNAIVKARVITRENTVLCGVEWVNEVFYQIDSNVQLEWYANDADEVAAGALLFEVTGPAPALLTGERVALNFLQLLSGVATTTAQYVKQLEGTNAKLYDTRKTIPGLRLAQKYAVRCGGGYNHRMGLYDAFLIKENHICACGSIADAVSTARGLHPNVPLEVEVESLEELQQALDANVEVIMLDNFDFVAMREAVAINQGRAQLESSGNVSLQSIREIAQTGVDRISVGALTKHLQSIDLSMRILEE